MDPKKMIIDILTKVARVCMVFYITIIFVFMLLLYVTLLQLPYVTKFTLSSLFMNHEYVPVCLSH